MILLPLSILRVKKFVRSSSDHQDRNIPRQGKIKGKSGAESNEVKKSVFIESSETGMVGESGEDILSNKAEEPDTSAMSESESADSEPMEVDVSNALLLQYFTFISQ